MTDTKNAEGRCTVEADAVEISTSCRQHVVEKATGSKGQSELQTRWEMSESRGCADGQTRLKLKKPTLKTLKLKKRMKLKSQGKEHKMESLKAYEAEKS